MQTAVRGWISAGWAAAIAINVVGPAWSDQKASYIIFNENNPEAISYLDGLSEGVGWANASNNGSGKIYCPPPSLSITASQYFEIIKQEVKLDKNAINAYAGHVLIRGLKRAFPCGEAPK